jgi:uncharacterized membrane protein
VDPTVLNPIITSSKEAIMDNKYVRGAVTVVIGFVILGVLLWLGEAIATSSSADAYGLSAQGAFGSGGWLTWLIVGAVVLYVIYVLFAEADMFKIGTRDVVMMAIGAALYGVLSWVFNIVPVPSVSLVSLRPVVAIPIFFGFAFGPAVGFFTGAFGNVLGDALTGWGVFPVWDIGNGLMGLIPGLAGMYLMGRTRGQTRLLLWISAAVLALGVLLPLISPNISDPFSGEPANFGAWWYVTLVVLIAMLGMALAPRYWPYVLGVLTLAFIVFGLVDLINNGFSTGVLVVWLVAVVMAYGAYYVNSRAKAIGNWLDDKDTTSLVIWGTLGVIVGMGFSSMADIIVNGYSFTTAFVGEFVPAAVPNTLFAVILTPLLYAAWRQARAMAGR